MSKNTDKQKIEKDQEVLDTKEVNVDSQTSTDEVVELEKKLKAETESKLRALADFQNYKRRMDVERIEWMNMASSSLLHQLADLIDNVERANQMDGDDKEKLLNGYEMVFEKIKQILKEQGLEEVETKVGDTFDPTIMEAISTVKVSDENQNNTVIHIESVAYKNTHKNNLFRTAKVIIGKFK